MTKRYKTITKLILSGFILGFMAITPAKAQFGDIGAFLEAGANDASILTREYIKPFPTGFGTGLNAGFTESAAPKKLFGFSLQIRPSVAVVPSGDQSFDISALNLEKIRVASGEDPVTQTILFFPGWFLLGIRGSLLGWSSYAGKKNEFASEEEEPYTSYEEIITSLEKLEREEKIVENPKYKALSDYDPLYPPHDNNPQSKTSSYPVGSSDTANFNQDDSTEDKENAIDKKQSKDEY